MEPSLGTSAPPLPSLTPSPSVLSPALRTYMEPAGRSIGLFRTPTLLAGQKHSLTPSPPSLPPSNLPTSPPPPIGLQVYQASTDWRDWIKQRHQDARGIRAVVTQEDVDAAAQALAPPFSPPPL